MINKKIMLIIGTIITLCISVIPIAYAALPIQDNQQNELFYTTKTEVSKTEKIEMILNLDKISYAKSVFTLTSNLNINNIELQDNQTQFNLNNQTNKIKIEINKEEINLDKITFSYNIPDTVNIGDKITFKAVLESSEESEKGQNIEVEEIISIIESNNNENKEELNEGNNSTIKGNITIEQNKNKTNNLTQTNNNSQSTSMKQNVNTTTVIYKGSYNNYLSGISIEGYNLKNDFSKDSNTYFLDIEKSIDNINITAEAENANAKINIYGNNDLKSGENKILICVTAENGSVRTYRIFVNIKS